MVVHQLHPHFRNRILSLHQNHAHGQTLGRSRAPIHVHSHAQTRIRGQNLRRGSLRSIPICAVWNLPKKGGGG